MPRRIDHQKRSRVVTKRWRIDLPLLVTLIGLSLFGLVAIFNASTVIALRDFGNQYYFFKDQLKFLLIGFITLGVISQIHYRHWYIVSVPLLIITILLLLAVFIPGIGVHALGAKRWVNLGFIILQPTELAKLTIVIYLSAWFSRKEKGRLLPFLVLVGLILGLVILQPDLGTAVIIITIAGVLYFLSGAPLKHFFLLAPLLLGIFVILAVIAPYRFTRIMTFLNPNIDPLGSSYHIRQILIALGSGGMFGVGLGKSRQKFEYLPEANTDSIFAVIGEEIGFFGALVILVCFLFIFHRTFLIARKSPDMFSFLLGCGIATWFSVQTLINLASMVALVPLTGVPLPLLSYGGSNLISLLIGFGIVCNISTKSSPQT